VVPIIKLHEEGYALNELDSQRARPLPSWVYWAQLVRIPTVFTVIAQVLAAFLVTAGSPAVAMAAWPRMVLILLAAVAVYWSGMILNDLWDIAEDRKARPDRPLPSGAISITAARTAAWTLLFLSIALAAVCGVVTAGGLAVTFAPPVIAGALAIGVVLYNGPLKPTPFAPLTMGVCRMLCFLLGASPLVTVGTADFMHPQTWFAVYVLAIAAGFGVYIAGVTTVSRQETEGGRRWDLVTGLLVALMGAVILALAPRLAPVGTPWAFFPDGRFALLIGLITLPVALRGLRAVSDPQPELVQNVVRIGILNLIPFSAALAMIVGGLAWAFGIFALAIVAILTSAKFRVT
jgi:4-hydroxybenzoate polyprenyltransferase